MDFIQQFKVDFGIIGISGIDNDGSLLDFDYREVRVAQAIIANSRKVFLVADHTKFGRNAMVRLGRLSQMDALFTDREPPEPLRNILVEAQRDLYVAEAAT
jgi:DeoR family glycerol-3-phosphate regulon repressor